MKTFFVILLGILNLVIGLYLFHLSLFKLSYTLNSIYFTIWTICNISFNLICTALWWNFYIKELINYFE